MTTYALLDGYLYRVKKKTPNGFSLYFKDSSKTFNVRSYRDMYNIIFLTESEKCAIEPILEEVHRRNRRCCDTVCEGSAHTLIREEDLYTAHKHSARQI